MKQRPWLWLVLANVVFIAGLLTLVVIAVRHRQPTVPLTHGR